MGKSLSKINGNTCKSEKKRLTYTQEHKMVFQITRAQASYGGRERRKENGPKAQHWQHLCLSQKREAGKNMG